MLIFPFSNILFQLIPILKTLCQAKGILVRLIGGVPYWSYGLSQVVKIAEKNIAFAAIADGRTDLLMRYQQYQSQLCDAYNIVKWGAKLQHILF